MDDAFTVNLDFPTGVRATLRASMLVRHAGPRFILHGTHGSFVKYGLDPQEDQLKTKLTPAQNPSIFGVDSEDRWGLLDAEIEEDKPVNKRVKTERGSYIDFYNNVADSILNKNPANLVVTARQAAAVIRFIELAQQSSTEKRSIHVK